MAPLKRPARVVNIFVNSDIEMYRQTMLTPTQLCKTLGDDRRLSLVCLLHGQGEVCVCDLVTALDSPQSTVSRHLAQLRQCQLVVARRQGTWMHYQLNPDLPAWAWQALDALVIPARQTLALPLFRSAC